LIADLEWLQQYASDKVKTVQGEKDKQKWAHVSAYIAQTIAYIASEYDASKIMVRLEELEKKVNELREKDSQAGKRS